MTHLFNKISFTALLIAIIYISTQWHTFSTYIYSRSLDLWYTKWFLLLPLLTGFVLWHFLSLLQRHPEWHEYHQLNAENKASFYKNSAFAMYVLKNSLLTFLSLKTINDGVIASGHTSFISHNHTAFIISYSIGIVFYFMIYKAKLSRELSKNLEH